MLFGVYHLVSPPSPTAQNSGTPQAIGVPAMLNIFDSRSGKTGFSSARPSRTLASSLILDTLGVTAHLLRNLSEYSSSISRVTTPFASVSATAPRMDPPKTISNYYALVGTRRRCSVLKRPSRLTFWTRIKRYHCKEN